VPFFNPAAPRPLDEAKLTKSSLTCSSQAVEKRVGRDPVPPPTSFEAVAEVDVPVASCSQAPSRVLASTAIQRVHRVLLGAIQSG